MRKKGILLFLCLLPMTLNLQAAPAENSSASIERVFNDWTIAFNQKKLPATCELFSKSLIADYQGISQRNYDNTCAHFTKVFQEKDKDYRLRFNLHNVYQSGNLAVARITWHLDIYKNSKKIVSRQDESLDVFEWRDKRWQMVNYLSYPLAPIH